MTTAKRALSVIAGIFFLLYAALYGWGTLCNDMRISRAISYGITYSDAEVFNPMFFVTIGAALIFAIVIFVGKRNAVIPIFSVALILVFSAAMAVGIMGNFESISILFQERMLSFVTLNSAFLGDGVTALVFLIASISLFISASKIKGGKSTSCIGTIIAGFIGIVYTGICFYFLANYSPYPEGVSFEEMEGVYDFLQSGVECMLYYEAARACFYVGLLFLGFYFMSKQVSQVAGYAGYPYNPVSPVMPMQGQGMPPVVPAYIPQEEVPLPQVEAPQEELPVVEVESMIEEDYSPQIVPEVIKEAPEVIEEPQPQVMPEVIEEPQPEYIFCMDCGTKLLKTAKFCKNCGIPLNH